jgi:hypothetical protein
LSGTARCLLLLAGLAVAAGAAAAPGDQLEVTGHIVNLRGGPSLEAPVLLRLAEGRGLVEIRRRDGWVEVQTGRDDPATGWIWGKLVRDKSAEPAQPSAMEGDMEAGMQAVFELFKQALAEYNAGRLRADGYDYFTDPEYRGGGVVAVTGTGTWLGLPMEQRMEDVNEVFRIWAAAVGEGPSITVNVYDPAGEKQMTVFR